MLVMLITESYHVPVFPTMHTAEVCSINAALLAVKRELYFVEIDEHIAFHARVLK